MRQIYHEWIICTYKTRQQGRQGNIEDDKENNNNVDDDKKNIENLLAPV